MAIQRLNLDLTPDQFQRLEETLRSHRIVPEGLAWRLVRVTQDSRHHHVRFLVTLDAGEPGELPPELPDPRLPVRRPKGRSVVVVGAGPAGLMAAISLVERGITPRIVEQGAPFPHRHALSRSLRVFGKLEAAPAMTCGLGGAGTYSDGKLFTRKASVHVRRALGLLAWFGQDASILVEAHPHVGSNRLPRLIDRIREYLEENGARFFFHTRVTGLLVRDGRVTGVTIESGEKIEGEAVVLAPGNSARSLFEALHRQRVRMASKPFAVGMRVEHPRALIDSVQLGRSAGHPACGAARYSFAFSNLPRAVYSFCMCPGGYVIPTPPEPDHLAVNGMSHSTRSSPFSNAAVVAAVSPEDWPELGDSPLGGIEFQRRLEHLAFKAGGGTYHAPAQRLTDFLAGRVSATLPDASYHPGLTPADLTAILPPPVIAALKAGIERADRRIRGYLSDQAVAIGLETLTSTPLRILRDAGGFSPSHPGLFPCGEGSGWAGGITSSAADGLACGEQVALWLGIR